MADRDTGSTTSLDALAGAFVTASRALVGIAVRSINAAPVEVTVPQHRLLVLLATGGHQTVGALAEQLGVDPSNASRLCDRLQRLGLIERERSESDRRAVDVTLTGAGRELLETVRAHRLREVKRILADVPETEFRAMVQALTTFSEAAHETAEVEWSISAL